jgi:hypothetical protein
MSKRYLFYTEENFAHRFVIVPEWASIADDEELVALLRTLLSEGHVVHGTVDREGTLKARRIEKEGPTGLIVTTTQAAVDAEMETRCLSLVTDDTQEQTRRVYDALADLEDENGGTIEWQAWHNLQAWIAEHGETRVLVPFVKALAELMPTGATRLRRDFVALLCLVRAHAILYQARRERGPDGRIVATIDDYSVVRDLVGDLIAESADSSVSSAMRETVEAVRALQDERADHVSPTALTKRLNVGQSATYDRIQRALLAGYLVDEAKKDERGKKLVVGAPLPGEEDFLPDPAALFRVYSGTPAGTTNDVEEISSGIPGLPAEDANGSVPLPGDNDFLDFILAAFRAGHVTTAEALEREQTHTLVRKAWEA